jgi:hypothetical protein
MYKICQEQTYVYINTIITTIRRIKILITYHLQKFPCIPLFSVVRTLTTKHALNKFLSAQYLIANYMDYVAQQIFGTFYNCNFIHIGQLL